MLAKRGKNNKRVFERMYLEQMKTTFYRLAMNVLCNLFIIRHPEYHQFSFPHREAEGLLGGYLHFQEDVVNQIPQVQKMPKEKLEWRKKVDKLEAGGFAFENFDIKSAASFMKAFENFALLHSLCHRTQTRLISANEDSVVFVFDTMNDLFFLSLDATQKYFELIGYWTAKIEGKVKRLDSGKGQKDAKRKRVKAIAEAIKEFVGEVDKEILYIDKAFFNKILCSVFTGAEEYPRHPQTITDYREAVEAELKKTIVLQKGAIM
jgi:hypothetical protein